MITKPQGILVLLTGLNFLNYLDRYVLAAVLPRVQEDLGLSNFLGGLLATVFLLGYFITAPIFGSLADKYSRKGLIIIGIVVWSLATIGSGLARSATTLLIARALVGVGEASYATIAPTIIDDIAPAEKKGRYLSVFFLATSVGSACGYIVGGAAERVVGWRGAFFIAGVPGLALALLTFAMVEPARAAVAERTSIPQATMACLRQPLYRTAVFGYCAYTASIGAFAFWAPKYLYARYGLGLDRANMGFGAITVVCGAIGTLAGGSFADSMVKKAREKIANREKVHDQGKPYRENVHDANIAEMDRASILVYLRVCAIPCVLAAPLAALAFLSPTPVLFFICAGLADVLLFVNASPVNAALLRAAPPAFRASAMAVAIFMIHLLGDSWSPAFIGLLADNTKLWLAMMPVPVGILIAGIVWWPRQNRAPVGN